MLFQKSRSRFHRVNAVRAGKIHDFPWLWRLMSLWITGKDQIRIMDPIFPAMAFPDERQTHVWVHLVSQDRTEAVRWINPIPGHETIANVVLSDIGDWLVHDLALCQGWPQPLGGYKIEYLADGPYYDQIDVYPSRRNRLLHESLLRVARSNCSL